MDLRKEARIDAALPVDLGNASGVTRNVSATGLYLETDASYAPGSDIRFEMELESPAGVIAVRCSGRIVRIEPLGKKVGVAVKITESVMAAKKARNAVTGDSVTHLGNR